MAKARVLVRITLGVMICGVAAVGVALLAEHCSERRAIREIARLGGTVVYGHDVVDLGYNVVWRPQRVSLWGSDPVTAISVSGANIGDDVTGYLLGFEDLCVLSLAGSDVTDKSVHNLSALKSLKILNIVGTRISRKGCSELTRTLPACTIIYDYGAADYHQF
jgi:hypothetical protein